MRRIYFVYFTLLLCTLCSLSTSINAQSPTPTPKVKVDDDIIKVESRLVVIPVSVTDASGQAVLGLKPEDFHVKEEGRQQTIESLGNADSVPLEIALLFDISASTDAMFKFEQDTAAKFLKDVMRPNDRATIFTIGAKGVLVQPRDTADKSIESIKSIQPTKEFTAFYDSVRMAAEHLNRNAPQGVRKVLVVISDGDDTYSEGIQKALRGAEEHITDGSGTQAKYSLLYQARDNAKLAEQAKVVKSLQNADSVFYSINPGGNSYKLSGQAVFGQQNMQRFAEETGGTAFLPKILPIDGKDTYENANNLRKNQGMLELIFRSITNELHSQYLIQYYSDADYPLNRYVKLDVGLQNRDALHVRAREGYYVK